MIKTASGALVPALLASLAIGSLVAPAAAQPADATPKRQAFFGDLHLHTSYSFDAWAFGTKTTPDEAYRFAKGQTLDYFGKQIRRPDGPLDFMAVTDHSEYIGVLRDADDPDSALAKSPAGQQFRKNPWTGFMAVYKSFSRPGGINGFDSKPSMQDAWTRYVKAANDNYEPGKFTTFIGYEWSSMPQGKYNLHRNVIFSGDHAPLPFSSVDSQRPDDLWTYLEKVRASGMDVIAIPHNANASGGLMFDWVDSDARPIDLAYAERRISNEPLTEIYQTKGSSETIPEISAADEFSNFEVMDKLLIAPVKSDPHGSYVREAEARGLILQQKLGVNPYKLGFVGGSDIHNGLSTSAENSFAGGFKGNDPDQTLPEREDARKVLTPQPAQLIADADTQAMSATMPTVRIPDLPYKPDKTSDPTIYGSAGLTGVWAEENTRPSIFAALRRKETFATSGTRLRIRFFGGWNYARTLTGDPDWVAAAYRDGVPMGGDLPANPASHGAPRFVVWAQKDPNGANLDRIQIIKLWTEGSSYQEKVFDVALSDGRKDDPRTGRAPDVKNTVDLKTATYKNSVGAVQLAATWQDPTFDPAKPAVYYARALEIPTPRWTTYLAVKRNLPLPDNGRATLQERAWASPIWYTPAKAAH